MLYNFNVFNTLKRAIKTKKINVLFWDLETSPHLIWTHYIGNKVSIYHEQIEQPGQIITIQYKFEGDTNVKYLKWDYSHGKGNDARMLDYFVNNVLNIADVAITQNGVSFDERWLRWRLNTLNLTPSKNLVNLDILTLAKQSFRAPSYKLDYRSSEYNYGGKHKMEFKDWIKIVKGDKKALEKMIRYGCKDVTDTQKIFWKELPYYKTIPISFAILVGKTRECCPRCSSTKRSKYNIYATKINRKAVYKCHTCHHIWNDSRSVK